MIRLTDLAGKGSFTIGGKKFEYGKVYSNPYASAFKPVNEAEGEDHEVSMANNSLDTIIKMATELKAKMGENEKEIPAWIQDHISKAENYISQAAGNYHEYGTNESIKEAFNIRVLPNWLFDDVKDFEYWYKNGMALGSGKGKIASLNSSDERKLFDLIKKWRKNDSTAQDDIKQLFKQKAKIVKSESIKEDSPCWKGYKQVGMKNKNGRQVPNCVPESVVNEAGLYGGVPKMYVKYLAVQKKVRELEDAQRAMGAKYFAEKNPKKKEAMMPLLKKGTNQLEMYRRNLADIERKYIDNLYKDVEQSPDFE
jgi:hypothetical protein